MFFNVKTAVVQVRTCLISRRGRKCTCVYTYVSPIMVLESNSECGWTDDWKRNYWNDFKKKRCLKIIPPSFPNLTLDQIQSISQLSFLTFSIWNLETISDQKLCWRWQPDATFDEKRAAVIANEFPINIFRMVPRIDAGKNMRALVGTLQGGTVAMRCCVAICPLGKHDANGPFMK